MTSPSKLTEWERELVRNNYWVAGAVCADLGTKDKDLLQDARYALCLCAKKYNKNAGVKFSTFAFLCVRNYVVGRMRYNAKRNTPNYDLPTVGQDECNIIGSVAFKELYSKLNETERTVLSMRTNGYKRKEVEQILGLTVKKYSKIWDGIKQKIKTYENDPLP